MLFKTDGSRDSPVLSSPDPGKLRAVAWSGVCEWNPCIQDMLTMWDRDRKLLMAVLCLDQIPTDPQSSDPSQSDKQDVLCLCFSPSEETLIASTSKNQLYSITMSLTEISKVSFLQGHQSPLPVHTEIDAHPSEAAHHVYRVSHKVVWFMHPVHPSKQKT